MSLYFMLLFYSSVKPRGNCPIRPPRVYFRQRLILYPPHSTNADAVHHDDHHHSRKPTGATPLLVPPYMIDRLFISGDHLKTAFLSSFTNSCQRWHRFINLFASSEIVPPSLLLALIIPDARVWLNSSLHCGDMMTKDNTQFEWHKNKTQGIPY